MGRSRGLLVAMVCCVLCATAYAAFGQVPAAADKSVPSSASALSAEAPDDLPDSPGATATNLQQGGRQSSDTARVSDSTSAAPALEAQATEPQTQDSASSAAPQSQSPAEKPVGTAAAGVIRSNGIAASQPAGVAIAPAKQHRVRNLVIKVGAIVAAGVAVGSVVALTEATPGKPPGAR